MQLIAFIVSRVSNKTNYLEFQKHLHINRVQNWKEATARFPKVRYAVNNDMSVVHIFIINNVQQPASYIRSLIDLVGHMQGHMIIETRTETSFEG